MKRREEKLAETELKVKRLEEQSKEQTEALRQHEDSNKQLKS